MYKIFVFEGNIFANTMENIQNLVKLPAACGEQNIITFAPNVYILNFLSASGVLDNETFVALTNNLLAGRYPITFLVFFHFFVIKHNR